MVKSCNDLERKLNFSEPIRRDDQSLILEFGSITIGLLSSENNGIGFGFPLGNSHDMTAVFPSVKFKILLSFLLGGNESNTKIKRNDN